MLRFSKVRFEPSSWCSRAAAVIACAAMLGACGEEPPQIDSGPPVDAGVTLAPLEPPVSCGEVLAGPVPADVVDVAPGYVDAAQNALSAAPITFPVDISGLPGFQRATVNFMLGRRDGDAITDDDLNTAGPLGDAVRAAIAEAGGVDDVDFVLLRRGLYYAYLCSRPIPRSLDEVKRYFGDYTGWEVQNTIPCSRAKSHRRQLYVHPALALYVAETRDDNDVVRETEILFQNLRDDGHLDFAAYTADGLITDRSTFATPQDALVLAAPYTCLTCHIDQPSETMSRVDATGTGAGCQ